MAKRITFEDVLADIKDEEYLFPRGEVTTICVLTLQNGRQVVGTVFGQSYDREIGKAEARKKAIGEIWPLLVYRAHCEAPQQTCRVCGCTQDDCSGCVERTGERCFWVAPDLCSACWPEAEAKAEHDLAHVAQSSPPAKTA